MRIKYVPELDGLRGIAAVVVVLFHSDTSGPVRGGFTGVDIFFVLSAYLITAILVTEWRETSRIDLWRFYWRRFLRLMPPLLLALVAYLIFAPLAWPSHPHARDAIVAALYLSDYSYTFWSVPLYLRHTWSLAVEEHFYLLWPLLVVPLLRSDRRLMILGLSYAALTMWRFNFTDWHDYYYRFDTHATGLVLGAWLFFALPGLTMKRWMAYAALGMMMFVMAFATIDRAAHSIILAEIGAAVLIGCAATGNAGLIGAGLRHPILLVLGKLSYGIYLWHFPIAYFLRDDLGFGLTAAVALSSSTILAGLSYVTVERWARNMKSAGDRSRPQSEIVANSTPRVEQRREIG